ncbi:YqjF family protein [Brevibacillus sp. B_LB10_24]|uniref:YqjF family protein n=1 Tax=Brevibacillus sp. B_LB10_24 TaxID=3380645 RepID=UPI0038BB214D
MGLFTFNQKWIMTQTWEHLLFAHWPVSVDCIRRLVPDELEVDTFDGQAWISIIPFLMSGIRLKVFAEIPYFSTFPEINLRTYVKSHRRPGIFFITLDASDPLVVEMGKLWYHLPYHKAKISFRQNGQEIIVHSRRTPSDAFSTCFDGCYRPASIPFAAQAGTIEHWLMERYVLYSKHPRTKCVYWAEVYHDPWKLHTAEAHIGRNTLADGLLDTPLGKPALLHYSKGVHALVGPIHPLR